MSKIEPTDTASVDKNMIGTYVIEVKQVTVICLVEVGTKAEALGQDVFHFVRSPLASAPCVGIREHLKRESCRMVMRFLAPNFTAEE